MPETNKPLRIAMLGHKRVPSREGGVEIVVGELSTRMVQRGCQVTCYNRKGHHVSGADFDETLTDTYQGVRLKSVWTLDKRGLAAMTASFSAALKAAFGRYDVVHFHAEGPCAMMWLPKLFGKRCIATIHGLDHQRVKWGKFASWYILFGEKCAAKLADEIIVLSENVQRYFEETYGRKTVFLPNGVSDPTPLEANEIRTRYGLEKDEYILFLGRLVPEKGPHHLIEAYRRLNTDKRLVIAGGASDTDAFANELKAMAADDDRIIFTDFVQGDLLSELYSNAYLYVLPSSLEGMPLSLLEAMSYGNCCVTSDIPECTSVVGEAGAVAPCGDVAALAEVLQHLCDTPTEVEQRRVRTLEIVRADYGWDDITDKTLKIYGVNDR